MSFQSNAAHSAEEPISRNQAVIETGREALQRAFAEQNLCGDLNGWAQCLPFSLGKGEAVTCRNPKGIPRAHRPRLFACP